MIFIFGLEYKTSLEILHLNSRRNGMLVLSRKCGEEILIDEVIRLKILENQNGRVRIGIEASKDIQIVREEVLEKQHKAG